MKERPILFSAPMVRAILEDRKGQTRRIVKSRHEFEIGENDAGQPWPRLQPYSADEPAVEMVCPYGLPGDGLWVRETWGVGCRPDPSQGWIDGIEYRADVAYLDEHDVLPLYTECVPEDFALEELREGWHPSIHMPRWASRINLEVTGVRVERLQDISDADAVAEGIERSGDGFVRFHPDPADTAHTGTTQDPRLAYRGLWESINGVGSWDVNPWVWVVEFKRAQ